MHNLPLVAQTLDFTCGAACFESMYQYLFQKSLGEMHFAQELKTLEKGYTEPSNIVALASKMNLRVTMTTETPVDDLLHPLQSNEVTFLTWWDEDAGHYSLLKHISKSEIILMDPWTAREGKENRLDLETFILNWKLRGARIIRVSKI